jgi:urea-proton symporter
VENVLTPMGGVLFLAAYGVAIIGFTAWIARRYTRDKVEFLLANRNLRMWPAAMSIASSWIWAPALFVSAQKAYEQGTSGLFWFVMPNFLSLIVFSPLALQIRKKLPQGYTLPELMRLRHGQGVHALYIAQFLGLQVCSYAVQILAGAGMIHVMTGLSFVFVAFTLAAITLTYTWIGGFRSTVTTDFIQMALILGVASVVVPWAISAAGGVSAIAGGLAHGTTSPFDPWVAFSFGIPVTIGLLSGPIGDQMHWERAYAIRSDREVIPTFLLAAVIFITVPLAFSVLGFLAANPAVSGDWVMSNSQMIAPIAVAHLLPRPLAILYTLMILAALCSTLDSVLCAAGSLVAVDLDRDAGDEHDRRKLRVIRIGMFATAVLGIGIALVPGLTIVHLFLFYGTWRASTMIPTVLTLYWDQLDRRAVFVAILGSLIFGAPVYALGTLLNNAYLSVAGSLTVVLLGLSCCVIGTLLAQRANIGETATTSD